MLILVTKKIPGAELSKFYLAIFLITLSLFTMQENAAGAPRRAPSSSSLSSSEFVVDPYLGFETGYLSQTGIPSIKVEGVNFGIRFAYKVMGIDLGLDYMMGSENSEQTSNKSDYKPTDYGLYVGYKSSFALQVYAVSFISSKAKIQSSTNSADFSGTGYKLGIGWKCLSFMSLNLEAITRSYAKYDGTNLTSKVSGSMTAVSVSFPLF